MNDLIAIACFVSGLCLGVWLRDRFWRSKIRWCADNGIGLGVFTEGDGKMIHAAVATDLRWWDNL